LAQKCDILNLTDANKELRKRTLALQVGSGQGSASRSAPPPRALLGLFSNCLERRHRKVGDPLENQFREGTDYHRFQVEKSLDFLGRILLPIRKEYEGLSVSSPEPSTLLCGQPCTLDCRLSDPFTRQRHKQTRR
jgi:hypothetical protein